MDKATLKVYGHLVAADAFGDSYVMSLPKTFDDIRQQLGVSLVELPSAIDTADTSLRIINSSTKISTNYSTNFVLPHSDNFNEDGSSSNPYINSLEVAEPGDSSTASGGEHGKFQDIDSGYGTSVTTGSPGPEATYAKQATLSSLASGSASPQKSLSAKETRETKVKNKVKETKLKIKTKETKVKKKTKEMKAKNEMKETKAKSSHTSSAKTSLSGSCTLVPNRPSSPYLWLHTPPDDYILTFFFNLYILPIRDPLARRGFLEYLAPIYSHTDLNSPFMLSTMAVASCLLSIHIGHDPNTTFSRSYYLRAVKAIRDCVSEQKGCSEDEIVISVLLL